MAPGRARARRLPGARAHARTPQPLSSLPGLHGSCSSPARAGVGAAGNGHVVSGRSGRAQAEPDFLFPFNQLPSRTGRSVFPESWRPETRSQTQPFGLSYRSPRSDTWVTCPPPPVPLRAPNFEPLAASGIQTAGASLEGFGAFSGGGFSDILLSQAQSDTQTSSTFQPPFCRPCKRLSFPGRKLGLSLI